MRRPLLALTTLTALTALALPAASVAVPDAATAASPRRPAATGPSFPATPVVPARPGLPADGPAALYRDSPRLPRAQGWPARDDVFPLTSGTGRLADGAYYWTDYLYDDHGATTASPGGPSVTAGSPSFGTYTYPSGPRHAANAADIFRTAVALRKDATYWRVDWTTLADRSVPMAVWTFDRDASAATGESAWPAGAGVSSPGIDTALLISSRGARLVDIASGRTLGRLPTTVTLASRSFVVRVPRTLLPVRGDWRLRVAAGLSNADGTGLARPPSATPAQPFVYNVGFRTRYQEAPANNFWNDLAQTQGLDKGTVARFGVDLHWRRLARRLTTPQRTPAGWNDRWYVSRVSLGNGVKVDPASIADGSPNYLGRVQPYSVYVPKGVTGRTRHVPLTFLLHSLTQNHNQYAATTPKLVAGACEQRRSLCVTTLGRGPDGNYFGTAELDFWQAWHAVSRTFRLDPDRTVLSGYSMGGIGTNQLAMAHPDLFARAITLAGGVGAAPSLKNLRWVPTYLAGGAADELVTVQVQKEEADGLKALGLRYRWIVVSAMDHVAYELCDCFGDAVAYMRGARRVTRPDRFDFLWSPKNGEQTFGERGTGGGGLSWTQRPDLGVGTTGAYWVRSLRARSATKNADVGARSLALPARAVRTTSSTTLDPTFVPAPATVSQQTWSLGAAAARRPEIRLTLSNVASLRLLVGMAGIEAGQRATLRVTTDGPTTLLVGARSIALTTGTRVVHVRG